MFGIIDKDIDYDIETYPNIFTFLAVGRYSGTEWLFEISDRRNDLPALCEFIDQCGNQCVRGWGFNSIGFDYPVIHYIYEKRFFNITVEDIYKKAMDIINGPFNDRFKHLVWESEWLFEQIDLFKVHHFDNVSKSTSLKILEFNMGMNSIEDLPFPVGTILNDAQKDFLIKYNRHDVKATADFGRRSESAIKMRERLTIEFGMNMMNCSDVKIGEKILIHEIEKAGISTTNTINGKKVKKQTHHTSIKLVDTIFPYVRLEHPEFVRIKEYLEGQVITETKGVFNDLIATVDGLEYKIGTGGLHASVDSQTVVSNETHQLIDVDVASYYPNMGIKNKLYPAHLGPEFCDAYDGVYQMRKKYPKSAPENGAYKLALNGAYGGSNNKYSPFFDTFYTMSITVNGQLLLLMLVEQMLKIPGLRMIQCNTDGITYLCPREHIEHTRAICKWWEQVTKLELEGVLYSHMFIRDVNSYIAVTESGKVKRIGAYAHVTAEQDISTRELPHHKNWSSRVVALAAEQALVHGKDVREFITNHINMMDFFLRTKVPRSASLEWGGETVSNIVRYYISHGGKDLVKVMPPTGPVGSYKRANKLTDEYYNEVLAEVGDQWDERIHTKNRSVHKERRGAVNKGYNVTLCNNIQQCAVMPINFEWYITETEKLVKPLN